MRIPMLAALLACATFCGPQKKTQTPTPAGQAPAPEPAPIPAPTPVPQPAPAPTPTPEPTPPVSKFVKAEGTQLVLEGKPFTFTGSNFYRLGLLDDRHTETQVYEIAEKYAATDVKVLRIWGFNCGYSDQKLISGFKKGKPVYNERAFRRLDLAVDAAAKNGLKLILPLINFNGEYCSMSTFTRGIIGNQDTQLFYSDPRVRAAFKDYVKTVLNRVNTLTKVAYKDEPALMAIELSNEAHTEDWYEKNRGIKSGELVYQWAADMSTYVKSIDQNHLVTIGDEGYKAHPSSADEAAQYQWMSNGSKGVDFERNIALPNIDLATVHFYPSAWQIPRRDFAWLKDNVLKDRARIAHAARKPVLMEEVGVSTYTNQQLGWASDPAAYFKDVYSATAEFGYVGNLAWQLVPDGNYEDGDYIFTFSSPAGQAILR